MHSDETGKTTACLQYFAQPWDFMWFHVSYNNTDKNVTHHTNHNASIANLQNQGIF